jgi:hypothetical protein
MTSHKENRQRVVELLALGVGCKYGKEWVKTDQNCCDVVN